jgi:hypothetical protein
LKDLVFGVINHKKTAIAVYEKSSGSVKIYPESGIGDEMKQRSRSVIQHCVTAANWR